MEVGCNLGYGDVGVDNWGMCVGECGGVYVGVAGCVEVWMRVRGM